MKKILLLLLAAALMTACTEEVKRPTEDSLMTEEAFALAEGMRKAYAGQEFKGMKKYCTPEAYENIIRDVKNFEGVELAFTPRWVEIKEDSTVHLYISWSGTWTLKSGKEERRGMALFELKGKPLKLVGIIRGNPFSQPEQY